MRSAAIAALAVAVACYPRLALWPNRFYPVWYLEAVLLFGGFVLWAFVFAWHTKYTDRPVFTLRLPKNSLVLATLLGTTVAVILYEFVDPLFRVNTPEDYPTNLEQWLAMTLFSLAFNQLFLVFAPFDWAVRLFHRRSLGVVFTVLFGVFVLVVKTRSSAVELTPSLFWLLIVVRAVISFLSVWFYSRHGAILVWWWGLLLQTRHLLALE
jgi:hypothetical protein